MALGVITKVEGAAAVGSVFFDRVSFFGDLLYPTGGTALFTASLQAKIGVGRNILAVIPQDCGGYLPVFDQTNDKLKVYYVDNNNASDGPLVEVPNTTDLSAVVFNLSVVTY